MRFSAKGEYGIRAVLDVALYGDNDPVAVKDISRRQNVPIRFLEQVMNALKKGGIVDSFRGASGGYKLARKADEITLADVVAAVEGPVIVMECLGTAEQTKTCDKSAECAIREVFGDVQAAVNDTLAAVSLSELIKRTAAREASRVPMFQI
jgi:Rrf2 family transcriptional regulator, iron-sulfur cluster assembly transcription factor